MPQPPERHKNPARKETRRSGPRSGLGVTYLVLKLDDGCWVVTRGGVTTGAFAWDKSMAIGQAYAAASQEAASTDLKVAVYSVQNGKRTKEWESQRDREL
jgi:hypothetical protein